MAETRIPRTDELAPNFDALSTWGVWKRKDFITSASYSASPLEPSGTRMTPTRLPAGDWRLSKPHVASSLSRLKEFCCRTFYAPNAHVAQKVAYSPRLRHNAAPGAHLPDREPINPHSPPDRSRCPRRYRLAARSFQSHAAPRTPLESPNCAGTMGVSKSPPKVHLRTKPGRLR